MEQTKVSGRGLLQQKFQQEEQQKKPSLGKNILGGIAKLQTIPAELGIGGLKGIISTARGIGTLGEKAITAVLPKKAEEFFGFEPRLTTAERLIPESITEAKTPLEKVGKITEQIGEFMIPVGGEARALQALTKVVPKAPAIIRGLTRMAGVGAEFAGKTALQTGGELKEVGISGAIGAVSPIVGKIAGAIAKPIAEKFPERLMSIIFKTAEDDLRQAYKTLSKGQELNPTLAREALDRGLKGSSQNMAVYSFQKLDQLENKVQSFAKGLPEISSQNIKKTIDGINSGGITFDFLRSIDYAGKPYISVAPFPERTLKIVGRQINTDDLVNYLIKNKDLLLRKGFAQGGWFDKSTGETYLDVAVPISKQYIKEAEQLGKMGNQKSGFDLENFSEIPYGGTGEAFIGMPSFVSRMNIIDKIIGLKEKIPKIAEKIIPIENKKAFVNIFKIIKEQFEGGFFSNRAKKATEIINGLQKIQGDKAPVSLILDMRRFIDKMRNTSSFRLNPNLTAKQEEFKASADYLRKKLSDAGLKDLMNEERAYIEFLDSIISDASKRMNRNVLGLFDLLAGGGGMAAGAPLAGVSAALAVRGFQQPFTLTNLAQALYKLKNIPNVQRLFPAIPPLLRGNQ